MHEFTSFVQRQRFCYYSLKKAVFWRKKTFVTSSGLSRCPFLVKSKKWVHPCSGMRKDWLSQTIQPQPPIRSEESEFEFRWRRNRVNQPTASGTCPKFTLARYRQRDNDEAFISARIFLLPDWSLLVSCIRKIGLPCRRARGMTYLVVLSKSVLLLHPTPGWWAESYGPCRDVDPTPAISSYVSVWHEKKKKKRSVFVIIICSFTACPTIQRRYKEINK